MEGEDYTTEFSVQSSPAPQNGPEVYVLPLTEVSVPMSKQPGRSGRSASSEKYGDLETEEATNPLDDSRLPSQ